MLKNHEQPVSFDTTLRELEQIVSRLESGKLPLEQAINEFEQGVQLARQGKKILQQAEQRIQILLSNEPDAPLSLFSPENNKV